MSQNQPMAAQNKLGELFVNLGIGGVPTLLKGLNTVQAQFLLTKNAAEQFTKPLVNMSKSAGEYVTALDKINSVTGLSRKQLQDLEIWSKLNNVSFGELTNQLGALQQNLLKIRLGQGDISGFQLIGLDPTMLDYRNPLKALDEIKKRIIQLDEPTQRLAIQQLGLSDSLLYAWKQENNVFNQRLKLTDEEMERSRRQQASWNKLGATWDSAQKKFISNQEWINKLLDATTGLIEKLGDEQFLSGLNLLMQQIGQAVDFVWKGFVKITELNEKDKQLLEDTQKRVDEYYDSQKAFEERQKDPQIIRDLTYKLDPVLREADAPRIMEKLSSILPRPQKNDASILSKIALPASSSVSSVLSAPKSPMDLQNMRNNTNNSNYQVQITNYITGDNPQEIGQQTSERVSSVFELTNNPVV